MMIGRIVRSFPVHNGTSALLDASTDVIMQHICQGLEMLCLARIMFAAAGVAYFGPAAVTSVAEVAAAVALHDPSIQVR